MSDVLADIEQRLAAAVQHFWTLRGQQAQAQGGAEGNKDRGDRSTAAERSTLGARTLGATFSQSGRPRSWL